MLKLLLIAILANSFLLSLGTVYSSVKETYQRCSSSDSNQGDNTDQGCDSNLKNDYVIQDVSVNEPVNQYEKNADSICESESEVGNEYSLTGYNYNNYPNFNYYYDDSEEDDLEEEESEEDDTEDDDSEDDSEDNESEENYFEGDDSNEGNDSGQVKCPKALARFDKAVLRASTILWKIYSDIAPGQNFAISPLGIIYLAGGLGLYAYGETKREIYRLLNVRSRNEISCIFRTLNERIRNLPKGYEFYITTDYFGNIQYKFTDSFRADNLIGVGENYNFGQSPLKAANAINNRIASETNNKVTNVVDDLCILNSTTEIFTVSASYFSSEWEIGFEISQKVKEFRVAPGKTVPGRFYYQKAYYNYTHSPELNSKVIQLYFKDRRFDLFVILPDVPFTENKVLEKLANNPTGWYYTVQRQLKRRIVEVHLPEFRETTFIDSRNLAIKSPSVNTIFSRDTIQLKGAIQGDRRASVSVGRQKNVVRTIATGGPPPKLPRRAPAKQFISNYPSLFVACIGKTVVYVGKVVRPTSGQYDEK